MVMVPIVMLTVVMIAAVAAVAVVVAVAVAVTTGLVRTLLELHFQVKSYKPFYLRSIGMKEQMTRARKISINDTSSRRSKQT